MDEDADTLEQLQTILQRAQYQVLAAVDGHAALRLARTAKPNLIVSDLLLTGQDGYEVWKTLRADKETAHIPILVTSALTIPAPNEPWRPTPDTEWQLLSYDAFLPKPIDLQRFMRVVQRLLQPDSAANLPGGPTIMLAIEDEDIQGKLAAMLHNHNFGVEIPPSLAEVAKLAGALPPAAIILDYRAPNQATRQVIAQINKAVSATVMILIIDPAKESDPETNRCDGSLRTPLHSTHTIASINRILELCSMRRRTQTLSTQLITTTHILHDSQQMLKAQNKELEYTNARLRELDSLKEMLTGMVVHDLKSPLGAVLGALHFLQTSSVGADQTSALLLNGAMAAGSQMLRLVETLLEEQRLENGRIKPDTEPFDLASIIHNSVEQISSLLTLHHLQVNQVVTDDLPPIYADARLSQRILENLLDNAIKFSPRDGTITIQTAPRQDFLQISVTNEGPGIPKEQQAEIFNRFSQLKQADDPARAGFGLGLAFCQLATQAMNGSIWVESDGESGTTFCFTLPVFKEE